MAINARWEGYTTGTVLNTGVKTSISYSNGVVTIKASYKNGSWTPRGTWTLSGSSNQTQSHNYVYNSNVTFTHTVTENGTYSYRIGVSGGWFSNITRVNTGELGRLLYSGQSDLLSVTVTDRYIPKKAGSATVVETTQNSKPAVTVSNASNSDGTTTGLQVNFNGKGWVNYYPGISDSSFAPGSTVTVQIRNTDTPGDIITKTITLSYGIQPTATINAIPVGNTAECIVSNSNGSYSITRREYSIDSGATWHTFNGNAFTLTNLDYNTQYTVQYKTTYNNNIRAGANYLIVAAQFSTPVPTIEHSIKAINTFKHVEDYTSGNTVQARFELELKEGMSLQGVFLGEQLYENHTFDASTNTLIVSGLLKDQIYTITAFATDVNGDGEYGTIKFQTNGKIYDTVLEDPTSGNHVAPITFAHNVYNDDFSKNVSQLVEEATADIENKVDKVSLPNIVYGTDAEGQPEAYDVDTLISGGITVDSVMNTTSTNPVQNKVITMRVNGLEFSKVDNSAITTLTTAPTADNPTYAATHILKPVVLATEPTTKYEGYIYFITE